MILYFIWTKQLFTFVVAITCLQFDISIKVYFEISRNKKINVNIQYGLESQCKLYNSCIKPPMF